VKDVRVLCDGECVLNRKECRCRMEVVVGGIDERRSECFIEPKTELCLVFKGEAPS
jgi:hypothetical protein